MRRLLPLLALLLLLPCLAGTPAAAQDSLSDAQKADVETLVRSLLRDHPEIVVEALQAYESKRRQAQADARQDAVTQVVERTKGADFAPVLGNPNGDVTIVEFFDYQCGYCKRLAGPLRSLVEQDGDIRLVMLEFPILGPESLVAAKAALAARRQGLYAPFHWALIGRRGTPDEAALREVADQVGLDWDRLQRDMRDPAIEKSLSEYYALAEALQVSGTPSLVIGDQFYPGALPLAELKTAVEKARKAKS